MVEATGTNTLGFIVWTVVLAIATWFATVIQQTVYLRSNRIKHPFVVALEKSAPRGIYTLAAVAVVAVFLWMIFVVVAVYKDHASLSIANRELHTQLETNDANRISMHIEGWIDNQNQNHDAIVQVWLGVDNPSPAETLRDWKIAVRVGNLVREGANTIGQSPLKGSLNIPFLDAEFQRPIGVVSDMQGYVNFVIPGINQEQFNYLHLDRSATLRVSAVDSRGQKIVAEKNIHETWIEGHESRPAK